MAVYIVILAAAIAVVVLFFYCAFTENKRISIYKSYKVFGRFGAYLATSLLLGGFMMAVVTPILTFTVLKGPSFLQVLMAEILPGISLLCLGLFMTIRTHRKCGALLPDAQKTCVRDMIFCALGVGCKICVFFIHAVWEITKPREYIDSNGNRLYVYDGDVFTEGGILVGTVNDSGSFIPNAEYAYRCKVD